MNNERCPQMGSLVPTHGIGGYENGGCPCGHPKECLMRNDPAFAQKRREARARMARVILSVQKGPVS